MKILLAILLLGCAAARGPQPAGRSLAFEWYLESSSRSNQVWVVRTDSKP